MKLLLIDDDPFILKMLEITLKKKFSDAVTYSCSGGQEALDLVFSKEYVPDIVLVDYMMPGMDGIEVSKQLKEWADENNIFIYFLMVTAQAQKGVQLESLKIVDDFIAKPMDMDILMSRLKAAQRICRLVNEKNQLLNKNIQLYDHLLEINQINEQLVNRLSEVIEQMAVSLSEAIEYKDLTTGSHVLRVGCISEAIGIELGFNHEQATLIKYAGFFHDIGKIAIPDEILQKPGRLTNAEFDHIRQHSEIGAEIIKPIRFFGKIIDGIRHHHERWDGKGYPQGLKGSEIPEMARIIAIADVFDVIVSPRPYKPAKNMQDAFEEILNHSGTQFDPEGVEIFKKLYLEGQIQEIYESINKHKGPLHERLTDLMSARGPK